VEEFALRRKDGTFAPVNTITSLIYQDGEPIALHGISVDISRQKSIESALRSSEKKHRAMMNHAPDAILIADMNGNIIDSNPKARELFEYSKKEFSGLHFLKLHPREDKKKVKEAFSRIINQKIYRISDVHIQTKDGRIIDVDINGTHIELEDQILVVGIFREMTEYREKQEQLKASQKDLEARVAERTMKLMEANTALKVLLSQRDNEKSENEKILLANLQAKVLSYFQELKKGPMSARQKDHIQLIEKNLQNIMTEFLTRLQTSGSKLTPKENQVASLVREGMGTKEIAKLMNVSTKTVDIFRYNIRMKLGLNNRRLSLRSYLLPL
jgi:PAS domain S-box-containing protein